MSAPGEWAVRPDGRVYLTPPGQDLAEIAKERDQAKKQLAAVQKAHDDLLAQVKALESAIAQAGQAITKAEPT